MVSYLSTSEHQFALVRGWWLSACQLLNINSLVRYLTSSCCGQGLLVRFWSTIEHHLAVVKGWWSTFTQLSSCCGQLLVSYCRASCGGQGLLVSYLSTIMLLWPRVDDQLSCCVASCNTPSCCGQWLVVIYEPVPLKNPLAALCLGNEKQAAKHANNSKGEKHHTRKHLTHKRTGKGACKQAKQANKAGQTCKAGQPCKAGDRQNTQIVPKHYSLLQKKGCGNILGITFFWELIFFEGFPLELERYEVGVGQSPSRQRQKIAD